MAFDPEFDYILARSRTRESSTLTILTVASSASLILLALFIQIQMQASECINNCDNECTVKCKIFQFYDIPLKVMGIGFAVAGILYRKFTCSIHNNDENWLNGYIHLWMQCNECAIGHKLPDQTLTVNGKTLKIDNPLCYNKRKLHRIIALYTLPSIAFFGWFTIIVEPFFAIWYLEIIASIILCSICGFDIWLGLR
jgi:hypothetical protein